MKIPETAFFCTCEDAYLVPSIITLESIRQFHPDADCFIMGTFKQPNFLEWIGKFSIRYIPIRETDFFQDTYLIKDHTPMWPRECFWHLFTYHYLKEMGYSRSCCVDGDVLCVSPINMAEVFDSTTPLSVVHKRNGSINSGVLFYNHDMMEELKFSHLIKDFYQNPTHLQAWLFARESRQLPLKYLSYYVWIFVFLTSIFALLLLTSQT